MCVLIATGCLRDSGRSDELAVGVDTTGRYPVLRLAGVAPRWAVDTIAVVGAGPDGSEFGSVRSVLFDRAGTLYVVDGSHHLVLAFDARGGSRRLVGRVGAGPGEYRDPYSVALIGDSLAIMDPGLSRISLVNPAGEWIRQWRIQRITGAQVVRLYRVPPNTFWAYASRAGDGVLVRYSADGPRDTLLLPRSPAASRNVLTCSLPGSITFFDQPFGATTVTIPTPRGERVTAWTADYRLVFLAPTGDTLRVIERDEIPAPITDSAWHRASGELSGYRARNPEAYCPRQSFDRPDAHPLLGAMFYDDLQRLWVEIRTTEGTSYEVFDADGRLLGRVHGLPPAQGIDPSVTAGLIAVVVPDSLGEQTVHTFRLRERR